MNLHYWAVVLSSLLCGWASGGDEPPKGLPAGTRSMAARLAALADASDPLKNPFLNTKRVELFRTQEQSATELADRVRLQMMIGYELVLAGRSAEGVEQLLKVREAITQPNVRPSPQTLRSLGDLLAIANLRLAEQENCIARHSPDSCLMPIRGEGVHTIRRGSEAAIQELLNLLKSEPKDLKSRWLLNLAYMTLGEYPGGVPAEHLIPPRVFDSKIEFPRFFDVAPLVGLATVGLSGGCVVEDLDGDDDLDVLVTSWGLRDQARFYVNKGDGSFEERTEAAGLMGELGGLNVIHADYNNDGHVDIFILRGAWLRDQGRLPNSLLKNNGNGTFEDVTEQAGLLSFHPTQTAAWGDYDNDGHLDLFIGNEGTASDPHPCELFRNNGDGTFKDVAASVGVNHNGFVKGTVWGDYDNDGRLDLYLSCLNEPNILFHNDGPKPGTHGSFSNVTASAGVAEPLKSFPVWFWDYDNDGWQDILVASFSVFLSDSVSTIAADYLGLPHEGETPRLYRNNRNGTFSDQTKSAGLNRVILAMGSNFGDLDNDGWLDIYFGTGDPLLTTLVPNRMFRNAGGKEFQDVTTAGGFGHLQKGHGVAFADFDHDGDQDVYAVMGGAFEGDVFQNALFENPGFGNHWITLRLEGTRSNRSAIGARIRVSVETPEGPRDIHAAVSTGGSFGSASLQQEIGLGNAKSIRSVRVTWPAGTIQDFAALEMDRVWHLREGDHAARPMTLKPFDLSPDGAKAVHCKEHGPP